MDYGLDTKSTRLKTFNTIFIRPLSELVASGILVRESSRTGETVRK